MENTTARTDTTRVLAITAAGDPVPRSYARLVGALRDLGVEVIPLPMPSRAPEGTREVIPSVADLKRMAHTFVNTLRGEAGEAPESWIVSQLRAIQGRVDAVIATDARVALAVFPHAGDVWPSAVRIAVDGDYHLDAEWRDVPFDDLVVAHPAVGQDATRIREGRARLRTGGPLVAKETSRKQVDDTRPQLVVSFARLDPGDVDPLLFQLSLAHPERFDLLFLPSGRTGVDELVRTRAGGYGLRGKRTKAAADAEPWIRGAAALIGHAAPDEVAVAVTAGVPVLFFAPDSRLSAGDAFLLERGAAARAEVPLTIAVATEGLLPGGADRERTLQALAALEPGTSRTAAEAVLEAVAEGRPSAVVTPPTATNAPARDDDELEDIGGAPTSTAAPIQMPVRLRRAYLSEIILQQGQVQKQLTRARAGLATWQRRVTLARTASDRALADKAGQRVEGLARVVERLNDRERELATLRDRFAGNQPLSDADRAAASHFMSASTAAMLDRGDAPESAFTRLEVEDQLAALKRKMDP
ncbi:MAG: hypothetical protein CVU56_04430 [Deltaproteobacteria bacterium HGW-Deltaproteobacteria-14]|jgi:hypothetical protein|nr:MAG: hypothetical protein CVU56_04430 [Deltaproteobacteria bacterium HGW-Deltaproteobacteria-14]